MHTALTSAPIIDTGVLAPYDANASPSRAIHALNHYQIIRRNGAVVPFDPSKIAVAMRNSNCTAIAPTATISNIICTHGNAMLLHNT